jgi:hypothetical protein
MKIEAPADASQQGFFVVIGELLRGVPVNQEDAEMQCMALDA